jgi:hypothetical protein
MFGTATAFLLTLLGRFMRLTRWPSRQVDLNISGGPVHHARGHNSGLRRILNRAGLGTDPRVTPASIRAWFGRKIYDTSGDITDAALALGCESLDITANIIGLDWRNDGR